MCTLCVLFVSSGPSGSGLVCNIWFCPSLLAQCSVARASFWCVAIHAYLPAKPTHSFCSLIFVAVWYFGGGGCNCSVWAIGLQTSSCGITQSCWLVVKRILGVGALCNAGGGGGKVRGCALELPHCFCRVVSPARWLVTFCISVNRTSSSSFPWLPVGARTVVPCLAWCEFSCCYPSRMRFDDGEFLLCL